MAESNPTPQLAHGTGNAVGREVSEVSNRGLDLYKDEIIALYNRNGIRMQDLPQLVEDELSIKAKCAPSSQLLTSGVLICTSGQRHTGSLWTDGDKRDIFPESTKCS
jgi:hypothetical protein